MKVPRQFKGRRKISFHALIDKIPQEVVLAWGVSYMSERYGHAFGMKTWLRVRKAQADYPEYFQEPPVKEEEPAGEGVMSEIEKAAGVVPAEFNKQDFIDGLEPLTRERPPLNEHEGL